MKLTTIETRGLVISICRDQPLVAMGYDEREFTPVIVMNAREARSIIDALEQAVDELEMRKDES